MHIFKHRTWISFSTKYAKHIFKYTQCLCCRRRCTYLFSDDKQLDVPPDQAVAGLILPGTCTRELIGLEPFYVGFTSTEFMWVICPLLINM